MDEPNYAAELKQTADVFNSNRMNVDMYQKLINTFGRKKVTIEVISKVSKNIRLFQLFEKISGEKFISIEDALNAAAADTSREKILIYFRELDLYGLFTTKEYLDLVSNMQTRYENDPNISFRPQQIILSGLPQKLVFICYGDEKIIEKIRGYVAKKYNCEISSVRTDLMTEITVQKKGGNTYDEMQQSFHDLLQYVSDNDIDTKKMIHPLQVEKSRDYTYICAELPCDLSKHNTIEDIIASLKTLHGGNIVLNFTIVNGNMIVNNDNRVTVKEKEKNVTKEWIKNNPPKNRERKTEYYSKYKIAIKNHVAETVFGRMMKELGYETRKTSEGREWIKN